MKRALAHDNSDAVSLFPFLAVLLCTMGALIVLLVVMARQARLQASSLDEAIRSPSVDTARQAALAHYVDRLRQSQQAVAAIVARDRQVLALQETRIRQLKEALLRLQATSAELAKSGKSTESLRQRDEDEVARLRRLIEDATEQLEETRRQVRRQGPKVAIIPYTGPRGTERRPLYIECRAESVVLQPEGIVLSGHDFLGPLGPGNPLASALRAARHYLRDRVSATGPHEGDHAQADPYPLILVRPDGIAAYYRVRDAIESWGDDFGYELIDADWELAFPAADPELARIEQEAVETARRRRAELALAAPSRFGSARWVVGASPRSGGFERIGSWEKGLDRLDGFGRGSFAARRHRHGGREDRRGLRAGYGGDRPGATMGRFPGDRHVAQRAGAVGDASSPRTGPGGISAVGKPGQAGRPQMRPDRSSTGRGRSASKLAANAASRGTGPENGGPAGGNPIGTGQRSRHPDRIGGRAGSAKGAVEGPEHGTADGNARARDQVGRAGEPSQATSAVDRPAGGSSKRGQRPGGGGPAGGSARAGSSRATPNAPGGGTAGTSVNSRFAPIQSLASKRGRNWALPDASRGAVPITRPIKIVVRRDRLAILPDSPLGRTAHREGAMVRLGERTEDAMDQFVSSLWDHVATWGIAGNGLYWRPVLELHVAAGAQGRADDLKRLLDGSGLELDDSRRGPR